MPSSPPPTDPAAGPTGAPAAAIDAALMYLGPARRTCAEVARHLAKKGFGEAAITAAEDRLLDLGLLDDAALATAWVEHAVIGRRESRGKAAQSLAARGIDQAVIADALAAFDGPEGDGELERALDLGSARLRALSGPPAALRRRLWGYLARRGFDADTVEQACNRLLDPNRVPDDPPPPGAETQFRAVPVR